MKKKYESPEINVVNLKGMDILTTSPFDDEPFPSEEDTF